MKKISGGVCAPKGFRASGFHCGLRRNPTRNDLSLIVSDVRASAAGVFTTNQVHGATIDVSKAHVSDGMAQAILCNSGYANCCVKNGHEIANAMCELLESHIGIPADDIIVSSTGIIGKPMSIEPVKNGMQALVDGLGYSNSAAAADGILTTDLAKKEIAIEFMIGGKTCRIGAIAKGSGMIHPNMATMLVFATTDIDISPQMLKRALCEDVPDTFNMVSVDGDTSTNDMVAILANGLAGNARIESEGPEFNTFKAALNAVTRPMCKAIAKDGEGASKLLTCTISGAADMESARKVAKTIVCSSLFKTAMFGLDANWGRVLCAIGYSGANVDVWRIDVGFSSKAGAVCVCKDGVGIPFNENLAMAVLKEAEIDISVNLNMGEYSATAWGCDLTYDYIKISGNYRSR